MKKILANLPMRILISLSVVALLAAYTATSNINPIILISFTIAAVAYNLFKILPKMIYSIITVTVQSAFIGMMGYFLMIDEMPNTAVLFGVAVSLFMSAIAYGYHKFSSGKLLANLIVTYLIIDFGVIYAVQVGGYDPNWIFAVFIIAFIFSIIPIVIKTFILNKKYPDFKVVSNTNSILSKKVTSILKANKSDTFSKGNNSITRYVLTGDRILFIHEPSSLEKSILTSEGLFYGETDYSYSLEVFLKESLKEANLNKINKNSIMPIVVLNNYKNNKIGHVEIKSPKKPDIIIGAVYVCSLEGLEKLVSSLASKSYSLTIKNKIQSSFKKLQAS